MRVTHPWLSHLQTWNRRTHSLPSSHCPDTFIYSSKDPTLTWTPLWKIPPMPMPSRIILLMFIIIEFARTFMLLVTSYTCKITSTIPTTPTPPFLFHSCPLPPFPSNLNYVLHTLHCYKLPIMWQEVWTKHTNDFRLVLKLHHNMSKRAERYTPTHFFQIVVPKTSKTRLLLLLLLLLSFPSLPVFRSTCANCGSVWSWAGRASTMIATYLAVSESLSVSLGHSPVPTRVFFFSNFVR